MGRRPLSDPSKDGGSRLQLLDTVEEDHFNVLSCLASAPCFHAIETPSPDIEITADIGGEGIQRTYRCHLDTVLNICTIEHLYNRCLPARPRSSSPRMRLSRSSTNFVCAGSFHRLLGNGCTKSR